MTITEIIWGLGVSFRRHALIILIVGALALVSGCANVADAEDSQLVASNETGNEARTNLASNNGKWIAIVLTWSPVKYIIDKEFTSEVDCWNYYDTGAGESKMLNSYGTQVLDHQGNKPDKEYMKKHRPSHREYPTRLYRGITDEQGQVWLTCDIKGRYEGL
jgi:hypothetical protein